MMKYSYGRCRKCCMILPHRVGGSLVPVRAGRRLLGGKDFHEGTRKMVKFVGARDVPVQRGAVELREHVNVPQIRS